MYKLCILLGPPGSGKSHHAKSMEDYGYIRISQDDQGRKEHYDNFLAALVSGEDIVVDRMNFDKSQRDRYRLPAKENGYIVNFVEFCVPRQVCYDRCIERDDHPTINGGFENCPEVRIKSANSALNTFFSRYEEVTEEEGEILRIYYNASEKSDAIMVDIDGTLANLNHRLHFVKDGKKDWGSFFRTVEEDSIYEDVLQLIKHESVWNDIILCSGRPEDQTRFETKNWLYKHKVPFSKLIMRPSGNYKRDDITKAMLYRYEIKPFYNIKYVLDDRQQVVDKWRSMGLSCFQVRPGDF